MPMAKCYGIAVNMNLVYDKCGLMGQCVVCGGEYLSGFYSLLGIGLTYMWGWKYVFAEECI